MSKSRPRVTVDCVASRYDLAGERTIEYLIAGRFGGLISFFNAGDDGTDLRVNVYNHDPELTIIVGKAGGREPIVYQADDGTVTITYPKEATNG